MRRKKKEELETYYARFDDSFAPPEFDLHSRLMRPPTSIETTSINDSMRQYVSTTYYPGASVTYRQLEPYSTTLSYEDFAKNREEEAKMNIVSDKPFRDHYVVRCTDIVDLSVGRILKTLSAMKGKLMLDTAPVQIQNIECFMTPTVRKHIIMASKKLKMYGKNPPIIARFDEFGNRLPDEIELDFKNGVSLNIVNPDVYGEPYLELRAISLNKTQADHDIDRDFYSDTVWGPLDIPF